MDTASLRAATTLVPQLRAASAAHFSQVWRGDEWIQAEAPASGTTTGFALLDQEIPGQGWPHGQLIEILLEQPGIGELGLLLPALAAVTRAGRSCVWVLPCQAPAGTDPAGAGRQALPYAPALSEAGLDLARHIFVKPLTARESGWALEQSLRTAHLGALLGWMPENNSADADFRALRRLHLLAQRHQSLVFILRSAHHARSPSPASLRLQLQHDGQQLRVQVLKRRGRPLLEPVRLQIHPARWNRTPTEPATAAAAPAAAPAGTAASLLQRVQALAPRSAWPLAALPGHTATA